MKITFPILLAHQIRKAKNIFQGRRLKDNKLISFHEVLSLIERLDGTETRIRFTLSNKEENTSKTFLSYSAGLELKRQLELSNPSIYREAWLQRYSSSKTSQVYIDVLSGQLTGRGMDEVRGKPTKYAVLEYTCNSS